MHNKIHLLLNGLWQSRRMVRRDDYIRTLYLSYNSPDYKRWQDAGGPHGAVWRYKNKVIAVRLQFYASQSQALLIKDNGDRSLPVFNRLAALLSKAMPNAVLQRTLPRKGIWHIIHPGRTENWLGIKQIHTTGRRASAPPGQQAPTVEQRLTDFMRREICDLTSLRPKGINDTPWMDIFQPDVNSPAYPIAVGGTAPRILIDPPPGGYPHLTALIRELNQEAQPADNEGNEIEYPDDDDDDTPLNA